MSHPLHHSVIERHFNEQIETLLQKEYPKLAGFSNSTFTNLLRPLQNTLSEHHFVEEDLEAGTLPFVIVITDALIPVEKRMEAIDFHGESGFEKLYPKAPRDFQPIESVTIPQQAYIITDIDRGKETLNVTPKEAFKRIYKQQRSPLTIDEGIAILTQYPEFLQKNNCFSLLASRCGDQKVPALWISEKRPKLGWCWDRNPHTWLGSASCKERLS